MKMLNNVLEADVFEISHIPIPSPRCTKMEEVDPLGAAPPPARPVQVRPHRHHAEDGAVAAADYTIASELASHAEVLRAS